ncbi:hypothetical protein, partial [Enterobacter sichuanensis]
GNCIAPVASLLACKNRRLDKSAMSTPEKKPKKKAADSGVGPLEGFIRQSDGRALGDGENCVLFTCDAGDDNWNV